MRRKKERFNLYAVAGCRGRAVHGLSCSDSMQRHALCPTRFSAVLFNALSIRVTLLVYFRISKQGHTAAGA